MEFRNLLKPENIKYVPLLAIGLVRGIGEMALYELRKGQEAPSEPVSANITYYGTAEPTPEDQERNRQIQ